MAEYEKLIVGVEHLEEIGGSQEAVDLLQKMKQIFSDHVSEIEIRILEYMYKQEQYEDVLNEVWSCQVDDEHIYHWLLEKYYTPFQKETEALRKCNMDCLARYKYYYGTADEMNITALLYNGYDTLFFYEGDMLKKHIGISEIEMKDNEVVLIANALNIDSLAEQVRKTRYKGTRPCYEVPVYLYYDENIFEALVQCADIQNLLADNRVVILVGEEQLRCFFDNTQVRFPNRCIGHEISWIIDILSEQVRQNAERLRIARMEVEQYYSRAQGDIDQRIRKRHPKILFRTCYFTTVLQYHTRDMKLAAEHLGLETQMSIEQGAIFDISELDYYSTLNVFRPDVIVCLDHFRGEREDPKEIVWITWIQDPIPHIMDKATPLKLGNRDFVLNHFTTWKEFREIGYPVERMMDAPIPSNHEVYQPYALTIQEMQKYGSDICFVCHASDVDKHILEVAQQFSEEIGVAIAAIYKGYQQYAYESGIFFYSKSVFRAYLKGAFIQQYGFNLLDSVLNFLAEDMYMWFNQRVFRETLVDWILDAGFTNLKLWGNGWKTNPKYAPYAMGPAENGKTLSKVYQASKIVVGNNIMTTAAARAWETMLSGGFYLSNYIPEEEDITDIRRIITVGEDVMMFYDREDFIHKLHYYLEHEDERKKMIKKGRKAALEKMTFDGLMEKMLDFVAERI